MNLQEARLNGYIIKLTEFYKNELLTYLTHLPVLYIDTWLFLKNMNFADKWQFLILWVAVNTT
jgi:hypothetical protein